MMYDTSGAQFIQAELQDITEYPTSMNKFSDAIKNYIQDNCVISFGWVGATTTVPPVPDPVVTFDASASFPSWVPIVIPPVPDADTAMLSLSTQLLTNINAGIITPLDPTFLVPATFFTVPLIPVTASGETDQLKALKLLCGQIITGIKTKVNPLPFSGTHLTFVGIATMSKIG